MVRRSFPFGKIDRISALPDDLIGIIMGFLGANEVARLLVLSKRFTRLTKLYPIIEELTFDDRVRFQGTFQDFVSGEMARLTGTSFIRRFSLKSIKVRDPLHITQLLRDVLKHGVVDIEIDIHLDSGYTLPLELFGSRTLVKLKLGRGFDVSEMARTASLPSLETLILVSLRFFAVGGCAFNSFLSACPTLKELTIHGWHWETWTWDGVLASQTLRRLTISRDFSLGFDGLDYQGISFVTPSLTCLHYSDFVPDAYPSVIFDLLEEAKLTLKVVVDHESHGLLPVNSSLLSSNATNLIKGIRNVNVLELSSNCTFETLNFFRREIPLLQNLRHLTMAQDNSAVCWRFLPFLLSNSPNLKTLIVEYFHYTIEEGYVCECVSRYDCLVSCPVEVLDISLWDYKTECQLRQVKHFLQKLSNLKQLRVHLARGLISNKKQSRIANHLQMLPRASSKCEIKYL